MKSSEQNFSDGDRTPQIGQTDRWTLTNTASPYDLIGWISIYIISIVLQYTLENFVLK